MSGKPGAKRAPIDFSQSDIDQLTAGRRPVSVTRRLKATKAPGPRRRAGGNKRAPASLKRADLVALRAGRPSPALSKRLFRESSVGADALPPDLASSEERKDYPTQSPPRRRGKA